MDENRTEVQKAGDRAQYLKVPLRSSLDLFLKAFPVVFFILIKLFLA